MFNKANMAFLASQSSSYFQDLTKISALSDKCNMKKILLNILLAVSLTGCAKFDFLLESMGSVTRFEVQTPLDGSALVPSITFTITGVCDPLGGTVTLTGSSFSEPSVTGPCDPTLGTFSITATAVSSGETLDVQGSQTDVEGLILNSTVGNIAIHCAGAPMRNCALSGSGNLSDPYNVSTISCLQEMRSGLSCHYALANNIDASATSTWNNTAGTFRGWEPVPANLGTFTGSLNGRNRTISNLHLTPRNTTSGTGLFSQITGGSAPETIYDITLVNSTFSNFDYNVPTAIVAGRTTNAVLRNVNITNANADLTLAYDAASLGNPRNYIGLLIGQGESTTLTNSTISGTLSFGTSGVTAQPTHEKYEFVGGIAGTLENSTLIGNSVNTYFVSTTGNTHYFTRIGGVVGYVMNSNITRQHSAVIYNLTANSNHPPGHSFYFVGGVAGRSLRTNYDRVCSMMNNSRLHSVSNHASYISGFVGQFENNDPQTIREIGVRGIIEYDINSTVEGSGFGIQYGGLNVSDVYMNMFHRFTNGTPAAPWGSFDGFQNLLTSSTYNNLVVLSTYQNLSGMVGYNFSFENTFTNLSGSMVMSTDSLGFAEHSQFNAFPSAPMGLLNTKANLGARPNSDYVGLDFTNVWQRDPVSNLPELRHCP